MKKIDRYKAKLAELEAKRGQLVRQGKLIQAIQLEDDLKDLRSLIEDAERYEARPVRELLTMDEIHKSGIIPMIMECHLAADFLCDCAYNLSDAIKSLGFVPASIIPDIDDILKKTNAFASLLCQKNKMLTELVTDNETLLKALHKKTINYIEQRARPKSAKSMEDYERD